MTIEEMSYPRLPSIRTFDIDTLYHIFSTYIWPFIAAYFIANSQKISNVLKPYKNPIFGLATLAVMIPLIWVCYEQAILPVATKMVNNNDIGLAVFVSAGFSFFVGLVGKGAFDIVQGSVSVIKSRHK